MFNGKDSDMFVMIVRQSILFNVQFNAWKLVS